MTMNRDIDDVATVHLKSLDLDKTPGNERYLFYGGKVSARWVANEIRAKYPSLTERVPEGGEGDGFPVPMMKCDTEAADRVFGSQWKGWWESVDASVKDILTYEAEKRSQS